MNSTHIRVLPEEVTEIAVTSVARSGAMRTRQAPIQEERLFDFVVNGKRECRFGCSEGHLDELAIGHLCTEGIVKSMDEIVSMQMPVRLEHANVYESAQPPASSGTIRAEVTSGEREPLSPVEHVDWTPEAVFRIADEFALDKTAHARTRGAHSAFLCDLEGTVLCMREDIGRHNAFDKVVGWALVNGADLSRCMLYTSGRVPSDMAAKAVHASIPVLVSKSVATDQGIRLARTYNLTLICEAKPMQFDLVCG